MCLTLRIHGKPAVGFMTEVFVKHRKKKKRKQKAVAMSEYVLVDGQQSAMLSHAEPLSNDARQLFKYRVSAGNANMIFHGINECRVEVDMRARTAKLRIKSVSNKAKEMDYEFMDLPHRIFCVARLDTIGDKIEILP